MFEAANGGTVFLDEIGEIDLNFQQKLLRFLQEKEVRPLGSTRAKKVDVRILAATNRNLRKMVDEGKFREDLWYRLDVVRIAVPPLRERSGDLPLLVGYFLKRYNTRYNLDARITEADCARWRSPLGPARPAVAAPHRAACDSFARRAHHRRLS